MGLGRSRRGTEAAASPTASNSCWPDRRAYLLLAAFFTAVAIYGSLVPLRFRPVPLREAVEQFQSMPFQSPGANTRADWAANVLLFIPLGYLWLGAWLLDGRRPLRAIAAGPVVVLSASGLSAALEFVQIWLPDRNVSLNDVAAETIGATAGVVVWCACGQAITDWLRSHTGNRREKTPLDWLLEAYFAGLVVYSVWPLDLTISVTDLAAKYRSGLIALTPFAAIDARPATLFTLAGDVAVYVPVGMLLATWLTSRERPARTPRTTLLLGVVVVLGIETARLLVVPRFTSIDHVILGTLGVGMGGWAMHRWRGRGAHPHVPGTGGAARRTWLWLGLAAGYAILLLAVSSAPWQPIADHEQWKARYYGFWRVPFARIENPTPFATAVVLLVQFLAWVPLGGMLAMTVDPLRLPMAVRRFALALLLMTAAGIATAVEMLQVLLPPRVPDITDVVLATAGTALGMFVLGRFARKHNGSQSYFDR